MEHHPYCNILGVYHMVTKSQENLDIMRWGWDEECFTHSIPNSTNFIKAVFLRPGKTVKAASVRNGFYWGRGGGPTFPRIVVSH